MSDEERDWLEALDRAVQEVEALQAIYCDDDEDVAIRLTIKSIRELEAARLLAESEEPLQPDQIPNLELEMQVSTEETPSTMSARLYFGLPPGYPSYEAVNVTVLTAEGFTSREAREDLARQLQEKAREIIGSESVMEITQECQERLMQLQIETAKERQNNTAPEDQATQQSIGRRWIWVHHITNRQRKEDIVREAQENALGGYLKAGYPGVVVVEGAKRGCDEFVMWIKGNKSRPGGFGRQWGHHVRGELEINTLLLPRPFHALEESMSVLATQCRELGLEDEFLKFVMQHG